MQVNSGANTVVTSDLQNVIADLNSQISDRTTLIADAQTIMKDLTGSTTAPPVIPQPQSLQSKKSSSIHRCLKTSTSRQIIRFLRTFILSTERQLLITFSDPQRIVDF